MKQNYQFTYSFEDVQTDFKTKPIDADQIMLHLRDKRYEDGWLKDHDSLDEDALKLNLKSLKIPNLMNQILRFNELLFQQISSSKDVQLSFEAEFSKNYLLVPLSKVDKGNQIQYKLDFELIESTVNEKHWVSVQDFIDVHRYKRSLANTAEEE